MLSMAWNSAQKHSPLMNGYLWLLKIDVQTMFIQPDQAVRLYLNDVGDGNPYHKYCYSYGGVDYILGMDIDRKHYLRPESLYVLREMTKIKDNEGVYHRLRYIRDYSWLDTWLYQYV